MTVWKVNADAWVVLRLPSETRKILEVIPNSVIDIGKFGSFAANQILGRPYHLTYDIQADGNLRRVPACELNAEALEDETSPTESHDERTEPTGDVSRVLMEVTKVLQKDNRQTIDDTSRQTLSMEEIEELKKAGTDAGKGVIAKILASHTNLDEKTRFSLAKYSLRKSKKYLRRFTVLPIDVPTIANWMLEKDAARTMELREETLGLIRTWSNVHHGSGRWLVVDETAGLVTAALADSMGILRKSNEEDLYDSDIEYMSQTNGNHSMSLESLAATTNTLTIVHQNAQPNLAMLKYFGYALNGPDKAHPLYSHLKTLTWLQICDPESDPTYTEPEVVPEATLQTWKSTKRGIYHYKRRRWQRCKFIVDEAIAGEFDGLVVASPMDPSSILGKLVPLLKGGGHVVVYSPTIEPLQGLVDIYSKDRKAAYMQHLTSNEEPAIEDFPVDPRLLLAPDIHTSRVRDWQVLPGRTHPMMTSRGGADGFLFFARKVIPAEGQVAARGNFAKKAKVVG
ncbi:tRNA (adenine(58)-N(1))-methyltransferase non-catalytic subunit trm6 [Elasticomyces elasticus]|nr:tRNA (adenine(58)-N(1))-methyltransferase non-catalytic subunit trm6 [Elasticomyces elasticus]